MKSDAPLSPDDPRLSAYLLGELSAEENLVFEAQLRRSPEAREELRQMESMCAWLRDGFAAELEGRANEAGPSLSLLPAPDPAEKVVAFEGFRRASTWSRQARFASVGAVAAVLVSATVILPRMVRQELPVAGSGPIADAAPTEAVVPVGTELEAAAPRDSGTRVPNLGYRGAAETNPGIFLAQNDSSAGDLYHPAELGDPALPAELVSYFPEVGRGLSRPDERETSFSRGPQHLYLDTNKYPDPEFVHRRVELSGGVFRVDGEQTRSLFRMEQRTDGSGKTFMILKGMVRLELGEEVEPVVDEPDPSYDFYGPVNVSWHPGEGAETISLPSGGTLRKVEPSETEPAIPPVGALPESDAAERYLVRLKERVRNALVLAEEAKGLMETGDAANAATRLEEAMLLLDTPSTAPFRDELDRMLDQAGSGAAE